MLNKVDKLVEATMLALQGKLELKESKKYIEARSLTGSQKKLIKQYVKDGKKKSWSELIRDLEEINDYETLNQDVRRMINDIELNEKKTKKSESIDVNINERTMVSVEGNETIVDTEDATVIVSKKEDTFVPETSDDVAMDNPVVDAEVAPDTDVVEVPADDTVMPEDIAEPVDTELPTEDEELPLGESKKVENVEIEIKDDGKEIEVKTDNGEEVEVKDETEDKEDKEDIGDESNKSKDKDVLEVPEEDKQEDETVVEENKKLQEQVPDIAYEIAEKVAKEIRDKGTMNFLDIDNKIVELSGMTIDEVYEKQLQNDVYGCLGYEGIACNYSTGDFYTDEYAEKHPEIKEEGKHLTEGRVPENCYDTMIKYFTDVVKENAQNLDFVNNTTKYMDVIKDEKVLNDVVEYVLDDDELWNVIGETIQYYLDAYADGKLPFKYEGKQEKQNEKDIKQNKKINRMQEMIARRRAKKQEANNIPYDNTTEKTCPMCKKKYTQYPALSRRDNKTYICPDCGVAEAMDDYINIRKKKESLSKLQKLNKSDKFENKKVEDITYDLSPSDSGRKSFYSKARVVKKDNGDEELYSYNTHVGGIRDGKPYSKGKFSPTTARHQSEFFKQRGINVKDVPVEEVKKTEAKEEVKRDTNDLGIKEGIPKKEEPVPNTATKVQEGYIKESFEKSLYSYFRHQDSKLESVNVTRIVPTIKGIKIEAKLNNKNDSNTISLRLNKIQSGKSFDKYELISLNGVLAESKDSKTILTTITNKNRYIECRYILNK